MFWRRKKKTGYLAEGPRLDLDLPEGDWPASALAFHKRVNQLVSVIMADDESVLDPLPIIDPGPLTFKQNWVDREDSELGVHFYTDVEGQHDFLLRYAHATWKQAYKQDREAYAAFYDAWTAKHIEAGLMRRFKDQEGVHDCWKVGPDDVIRVGLDGVDEELYVSATRAWVYRGYKDAFG